jgi:hypothetical protein
LEGLGLIFRYRCCKHVFVLSGPDVSAVYINWDNIKFDLEDTLKKIININNDAKSTVNEMWNLFKNNLTKSINKNIPYVCFYVNNIMVTKPKRW